MMASEQVNLDRVDIKFVQLKINVMNNMFVLMMKHELCGDDKNKNKEKGKKVGILLTFRFGALEGESERERLERWREAKERAIVREISERERKKTVKIEMMNEGESKNW